MTLQIRHAEPDDFRAIHNIHTHPKAIWGTLQLPFPSAARWRKALEEQAEGSYWLVACAEDDLVGSLGMLPAGRSPRRRHAAHLGMAVRDDWQGQGVGTALMEAALELADNWLNLLRLELQVFTDNEPAVRLYQKFGFEVEGTLRSYAFRAGEYVDTYTMARLRGPLGKGSS